MTYDLIIVGGGPAGAAAAVYAARKKLKTLFITFEWGGQSVVSEQIYNWIGTTSLSGNELAENFKKHVLANTGDSLEVKEGEKASSLSKKGDLFLVKTESGQEFISKTILIASGSVRRKLVAKNADKFENKGLTYCASCDGPLFADMDVAVIGGGNAGFETAAQLLAYCKSVTLINHSETFKADEITVEKVLKNPKMSVIKNAEILEVLGDKFVEGLIYKDKTTGEEKRLKVSGIFMEIGQIPNTGFVKDLVPLDKIGRIRIDAKNQKTEVPGIWAAGDCTDVLYHQNNIAAGDAVRALEDIYLTIHTK
ncbi:MAG: Alkyl hydroperoxide reductase [Candidatus Nomurabacteria bacterium GW2011_GWA2_43_15]|uniref:Alkyl hydroperoxide reductase n=3 Tax=Candidatus Nomuraibacteriota TaxID=1752729 RepID=A0A0G1DT95_9BACT|nr:MAG: Alkyl hydroperoxide reductase [Candidatus Nomurabacteria bacterium GW2011_GWA2_43_15]KKT19104.1 MAG: Alkyl hydroperoxide reductase [Candidatus Nomurabacteria bacterium GW2011_GWB1_43_7]